jgi:hypothetical protein
VHNYFNITILHTLSTVHLHSFDEDDANAVTKDKVLVTRDKKKRVGRVWEEVKE